MDVVPDWFWLVIVFCLLLSFDFYLQVLDWLHFVFFKLKLVFIFLYMNFCFLLSLFYCRSVT